MRSDTILSFADQPGSGSCEQPHCGHGEDLGGLTYTVNLIGISGMRGAFEFEGGLESATLESKGTVLKGDAPVTMKRAGTDPTCVTTTPADDQSACIVWNDVFDLCGLLGLVGTPTLVTQFTVKLGDWSVSRSSEREWISFGFEIAANLSPPSSRPLSASLQLSRACASVAECRAIIPTAAGGISVLMTDYSIHLRGKAGVTHQAECHAGADGLSASGSTLVITAAN